MLKLRGRKGESLNKYLQLLKLLFLMRHLLDFCDFFFNG